MNKQNIIGIGLLGTPFLCIGALIGGFVMNKSDNKYSSISINIWKGHAEFLKELLYNEYAKNDELKKKLEEKA